MIVIALLGTLAAIAGLHALQRERYGWLGAAGSLVAFAGHALMLVAATATALAGREALDALFPLGVLAALVGLVLLGAATLRARMLPRWGVECCSSPFYLSRRSSTSLLAALEV
jgi:drug/metabolite transporter (DMT)-like permease